MLIELAIRDIALIERAEIAFGPGLNVLTGETGAGKSILLDALQVALGRRSDRAALRTGADQASVTAHFEVPDGHAVHALMVENGLEASGELLLRRTIGADGRARAYVNDQAIGVQLLKDIGDCLLEIHGQNDGRGLLSPSQHRRLLDRFGGHDDALRATEAAHAAWRAAQEAAQTLRADAQALRMEADWLSSAAKELERLKPEEGEEDRLAAERSLLMSSEKIATELSAAAALLDGGERALDARLSGALKRIERLQAQAMGRLDRAVEALQRAVAEAAEARAACDEALRTMQFDPQRLEAAEERLFALRGTARKFKVQVHDLPSLQRDLSARLADLTQLETRIQAADRAVAESRSVFLRAAEALSAARAKAASRLSAAVNKELKPLKLERASFAVSIQPVPPDSAGPAGLDMVEFQISTAAGVPPGSISKIASGGELARIALALKVALAGRGEAVTLIFDEIDQGVGGAVSDAVGARLARLGEVAQVIVVTHAPQVAARAAHHFCVRKQQKGRSVTTGVAVLDETARREEIARMLSGAEVTDEARAAAKRLIAGAS